VRLTVALLRIWSWVKSTVGLTICLTIAAGLCATLDRGPFILVNTIVIGGMLTLVATGLALVFGVMNLPMFAHGEYFMIGTLVAYYVFTPMNKYITQNPGSVLATVGPLVTIVSAMLAGAMMGVLTEKLVFSKLRKRSRENWVMNSFLLTVGISVVLINSHQLIFTANLKGIVRYWAGMPLSFMGVFISRDRIMAFSISVLIFAIFWLFLTLTRTGRAIRAVSQDEIGALTMGIDINGIFILTMSLSCALSALAGGSLLFMYPSYPTVGLEPLYMAWFVVILAGLGDVLGAAIGAFIVALLKTLTVEYVGVGWDSVILTGLIMVILIFRPRGIFGSEVRGIWEN